MRVVVVEAVRGRAAGMAVRLVAAGTVLIGGCAHERTAERGDASRPGDPPPHLVREIERAAMGQGTTCGWEAPPGSRVPRSVCRSALERERQRARSDGLLEDLKRAGVGL
jgi:hypothetical protein